MRKASHLAAKKSEPDLRSGGTNPRGGHSPAGISTHFSHDGQSDFACRAAEDVAVTVYRFCAILNIRRERLDYGNGGDITTLSLRYMGLKRG
jgi:hypothetical protein